MVTPAAGSIVLVRFPFSDLPVVTYAKTFGIQRSAAPPSSRNEPKVEP